jgi:hypothetical protein
MHRLVDEFRTDQFDSAHPALQAAFAHFAFVAVHPFSDGNGRVARALASVFTYRAASIPLMILSSDRSEYFEVLKEADGGQYQPFVDFVVRRCLDAMQLVNECALAADSPGMDQQLSNLNQAYTTGSGFSQEEIDGAGVALIKLAGEAFSKLIGIKKPELGKIELQSHPVYTGTQPREEGFRRPEAAEEVQIAGSSPVPLSAAATRIFDVLVPVDCGSDDDLRVVELVSYVVVHDLASAQREAFA